MKHGRGGFRRGKWRNRLRRHGNPRHVEESSSSVTHRLVWWGDIRWHVLSPLGFKASVQRLKDCLPCVLWEYLCCILLLFARLTPAYELLSMGKFSAMIEETTKHLNSELTPKNPYRYNSSPRFIHTVKYPCCEIVIRQSFDTAKIPGTCLYI